MAEHSSPRQPPTAPAPTWKSVTHHFSVGAHEGYVIVALEHARPIHIDIRMAKAGGPLRGLLDALATSISLGLENGTPLAKYTDAFALARFEPSGYSSNRNIGYAHSVVDYVARWLRARFLALDPGPEPAAAAGASAEGETCSVCRAPRTWTAGNACPDCGHVD
ncbi:MAG: hypothetical protein F4041_13965 [Acidobacteriia bacterium]|nr:hypothetical protein [Terriglobia bacterium]